MRTHRWTVWPAVAAAGLALASCSSGTRGPAGPGPTTSGRSSLETFPTVPATTAGPAAVAKDRAAAQAINLRTADLPGWSERPNSTDRADQAMNAQMARCAGAADPAVADVVDVGSPSFDSGPAEVSSDVTTVRTAAEGQSDLAALGSPRLSGCIQQVGLPYIRSQLPSGTTITNLAFSRLGAPAGIPDSFGFRLEFQVSNPQQGTITVTSDTFGFLVGRAEVQLTETQTGGTPDATLAQHLVTVLHGRAETQTAVM